MVKLTKPKLETVNWLQRHTSHGSNGVLAQRLAAEESDQESELITAEMMMTWNLKYVLSSSHFTSDFVSHSRAFEVSRGISVHE